MYRAGLLAVLLLAVAVLAGNATLTCTVESSETVDTTDDISVSFDFTSIAPVFPDKGIRFTKISSTRLQTARSGTGRWSSR
jgi:hypothetical protein